MPFYSSNYSETLEKNILAECYTAIKCRLKIAAAIINLLSVCTVLFTDFDTSANSLHPHPEEVTSLGEINRRTHAADVILLFFDLGSDSK